MSETKLVADVRVGIVGITKREVNCWDDYKRGEVLFSEPRTDETEVVLIEELVRRYNLHVELVEALKAALVDPLDVPHLGIVGACYANCARCAIEKAIQKAEGK